jgi:PAS domain S-box-containing protein
MRSSSPSPPGAPRRSTIDADVEPPSAGPAADAEGSPFFDDVPVALHWVSPSGHVLQANRAELDMLGYAAEEYLGHHLSEFHLDQTALHDILRRLSVGKNLSDCEASLRCKDGSIRHVLLDSSRYRDHGQLVYTRCITRHITVRRRYEETLRERELQLSRLFDAANDALVIADGDDRLVDVNAAACALLGVPRPQLVGRRLADFGDSGDATFQASDTGISEVRIRRADGTARDLEFSPAADFFAGRRLFVLNDVTERKTADRYRAIRQLVTQKLAEATTVREAAAGLLQSICQGLGYTVGALWRVDGQTQVLRCLDVWHGSGKGAPEFEEVTRKIVFTRGVGLPGRIWASGRPAWIVDVVTDANFPRAPAAVRENLHGAFGFPVRAGSELLGVMEFFSDEIREPEDDLLEMMDHLGGQIGQFLERKRGEEAVRASEGRLRLALDAGHMGTWDWEIRTGKVTWSASLEALYGLAEGTFAGTFEAFLQGVHAADRDRIKKTVMRVLRHRLPLHLEYRIVLPDGSVRWMESRGRLARDEAGRPVRMTGVCLDISGRKQLEDILRQRAGQLAEAGRKKDEFLAMLSHELRNPLGPIRNALEILRLGNLADAHMVEAREVIQRQTQYLTRIVDDLLDIFRLTHGKIKLRQERIDLVELLRQVLADNCPAIERAGLGLESNLPDAPAWVQGDATRLTQIITNLLNNAMKFTEPGGKIVVRLEPQPQAGRADVTVRDTGIGIAPDVLPRIFETFAQADNSLDRSRGGLGLGLAMVKSLVEMQGGRVAARSPGLGKGAEFTFWLPLVAAPDSAPVRARKAGSSAATYRILVVEDNRDAARTMRILLTKYGHEVALAHSGPEGVDTAKRWRPDVVLCDLGLPEMDGFEVARRLRVAPELASTRLIAISGYGQEEDRRQCLEAGFDLHLTKPVDPVELKRLLATLTD